MVIKIQVKPNFDDATRLLPAGVLVCGLSALVFVAKSYRSSQSWVPRWVFLMNISFGLVVLLLSPLFILMVTEVFRIGY